MDARFALVIALPFALAACSSAPKAPPVDLGRNVFEQFADEPAAPDSMVRQGDQLTYTVVPTASKPWLARYDVSCSQPSARMYYYTQSGGMTEYSTGAVGSGLPPAQLQILLNSAQLREACAYRPTPDWRALDTATEQDWLALDRNSAREEGGLLKIWTAQYLQQYQIGAAHSLIAQRHERLAIDCTQRSVRVLSHYNLDATGNVLDGKLHSKALAQPPATPESNQQRLLVAACQPAADWAKLPSVPARTPQMPVLQTPVAAPAVLAAINALQLPKPRRTLQVVNYRYDTLMFNGMKIPDVKRDDTFSRDPQSGQVLLQTQDAALGATARLTFLGLIELASRSFDSDSGEQVGDKTPIIGLSFSGDWQHLPENAEVAYSLTHANPEKPQSNTITCQVGVAQPASQLHPALQGQAKPLICTRLKTKLMQWTETFSYLDDYGVFVRVEDNTPLGRWTWHIDSVR